MACRRMASQMELVTTASCLREWRYLAHAVHTQGTLTKVRIEKD